MKMLYSPPSVCGPWSFVLALSAPAWAFSWWTRPTASRSGATTSAGLPVLATRRAGPRNPPYSPLRPRRPPASARTSSLLKMRSPEGWDELHRPNLTTVVPAKKRSTSSPASWTSSAALRAGIVYATTRKECEELAENLRRSGGRRRLPRRDGLVSEASVQERFMTDELGVVVATIAFGMGVDKPNVRFVIHSSVPGSLPAYIQSRDAPEGTGRDPSASCLPRR